MCNGNLFNTWNKSISPLIVSIMLLAWITGATVLTPGPPAIYVLESGYGTSSPCISTVSGNYVLGTALSSLNTVTIRVYVTYAGSFTIATSMVNNMTFAYTGSFSTTGIQYVTLVGTGKPNNSGNYLLLPEIVGQHPLGGQTCGVSIQVNWNIKLKCGEISRYYFPAPLLLSPFSTI